MERLFKRCGILLILIAIVIVIIAIVIIGFSWGRKSDGKRFSLSSIPSSCEIAFVRSRRDLSIGSEIWVMDRNGKNQYRIIKENVKSLNHLCWSSDGAKIIFVAGFMEDNIFAIDIKRNTINKLIENGIQPSCSPDGKKIAFCRILGTNSAIYVADIDGTNIKRLTHSPGIHISPSWSPDSKKIIFMSTRDDKRQSEIYIIELSSSKLKRLTNNLVDDRYPRWSPDGKKVAFVKNWDRYTEYVTPGVYIMDADGKNEQRITPSNLQKIQPFSDPFDPCWSPDGEKIIFTLSSRGNGNDDIYTIDIDGKNLKNLTNTPDWEEGSPSWRPIVKGIGVKP